MRFQSGGVLCLSALVVACSPTFNWRNVSLDAAALQAQLPCKPERAERQVPLTPSGTTLRLMSCEAGGITFALAWAQLAPAEDMKQVLDHWQQAGWGSLRQPAVPASGPPAGWQVWPVQVAGAQHLRAWKGPGLDHQGRALQARQLYFAQGGMAYQAAVYGPALTEVGVAPFFEALRLPSSP